MKDLRERQRQRKLHFTKQRKQKFSNNDVWFWRKKKRKEERRFIKNKERRKIPC